MGGPGLYPPPPHIKGIPTKAELDALPRLNTWEELKDTIARCELGELGRGPELQARYDKWMTTIKEEYGTTEKYLMEARLPWESGRTDGHVDQQPAESNGTITAHDLDLDADGQYLEFNIGQQLDPELYAVLPNDWPYNTPYDVEHIVVWSKLAIFHPSLVQSDTAKWARIQQDGFAGFTGDPAMQEPPVETPPGGTLFSSLREVGPWGWCTEGGKEVGKMVVTLWPVDEYECVWFVNPPRLQSVRGLSHFHVFARRRG
ncbi:hypothetical protein NliqN6_4309 [Naganishia liquefaciens]|uniref:Uncharacterized protein n=1 Tax=Naganishia liquefaciens TaxID=104408 RepID=A0A8H3TVH8_9TREE|nr:hypothetical protein NliqN6_4309 [Naganishia liquefaciens]